jgi:hypothetical protein
VVQSRLGPLPTTTRVRQKPTNNVRAELNRYSNRLQVSGKMGVKNRITTQSEWGSEPSTKHSNTAILLLVVCVYS